MILATKSFAELVAADLNDMSTKQLSRGRYVSGLIWLSGVISYREPELIEQKLKARVKSISVINLVPSAESFAGLRNEESIDSYEARLPVLLGIDVYANIASPNGC